MPTGLEVYTKAYRDGWKPEPRLSVSEWADQNRILGSRSGESPIRWRTAVTPYLREIMDALGPRSPARRVVFEKGGQIGGTEAGNNWIGFVIHHSPGPILILRPSVDDARRFSRQRLDPMIATTPALAALVRQARSRDGGNSMLVKEFPGGILFLTGSNSATGLKSMPIRWLFCDEVDEYPGDVDGQGDPIALAEKRCSGPSFSRRKVFMVSTPTIKGVSRIEREFLLSDQRRYFVPCPHCGNMDWIRWPNLRCREEKNPKTAQLVCLACEGWIEERFKPQMLARGEWRPTAEGDGQTIGFHLSGLYSPLGWFPWSAAMAEFFAGQKDPLLLKNFVNGVLGETWEERGDSVEPESLLARTEQYPADVPEGVGVLVASVDVQKDRLECQVKGYGAAEESWLIAYVQISGDPTQEKVWRELDHFLLQEFTHESGQKVPIMRVCVDSNYCAEQVYRFCKPRQDRGVFAVRGGQQQGKPVVGRPTEHNRYRAKLFTLCTDTAKEIIFSRLCIGSPGPGYCHVPDWIDAEYVAQLTAEKAIRKWVRNRGSVRIWEKIRDRNEVLDLEVYCLAALYILGPAFIASLPERAAALARKGEAKREAEPVAVPLPHPRSTGWIGGWRG